MTIRFADGTLIETPQKGSVMEFLYRHHPNRVSEYCTYIERNNRAFRLIDHFLRHNNGDVQNVPVAQNAKK